MELGYPPLPDPAAPGTSRKTAAAKSPAPNEDPAPKPPAARARKASGAAAAPAGPVAKPGPDEYRDALKEALEKINRTAGTAGNVGMQQQQQGCIRHIIS